MIFRRISFSLSQRRFWKEVRRKREEWKSVAQKSDSVVVSISPRSKMELQASSELSSHIYCGAFEWEEREWLFSELKATDVFFDIGANIGLFTLLAAEQCKTVIAFEPTRETFNRLSQNVELNKSPKNIQLINAAASDEDGTQNIYVLINGKDAWNSIAVKPEAGEYRVDQINAVNVDAMVQSGKIPAPTVIKIDVEGWEGHVLRGLKNTIAKYKPTMLIEFTDSNLKAAGTSSAQLAANIQSMGYTLYSYDPRFLNLNEVTDFSFSHKNLIAKPAR